MSFCQNCGKELEAGAKFCSACGNPVNSSGYENIRRQKYAGAVYKCPSCGAIISEMSLICPCCGYILNKTETCEKTVNDFFDGLNKISQAETETTNMWTSTFRGIPKDFKRKASYISEFPIPQSVGQIYEFMTLAVGNLDPKGMHYSLYTLNHTGDPKEAMGVAMVNRAWAKKIRQAYDKSNLLFANTPEFKKIQDIYIPIESKIKSVNKKRKITITIIVSIIVLFYVFLFTFVFNMS